MKRSCSSMNPNPNNREPRISSTEAPYAPAAQQKVDRMQDPIPNRVRQYLYLTHHNPAISMTEVYIRSLTGLEILSLSGISHWFIQSPGCGQNFVIVDIYPISVKTLTAPRIID